MTRSTASWPTSSTVHSLLMLVVITITTILTLTPQQVSATFTISGLPAMRNYDFPGLRTDVNPYKFNTTMALATFKDPATHGACQLNNTGKTTPGGILFINTLDAFNNGCIGYQALPDSNGWFHPCAADDLVCKQTTYDVAIYILVDPQDFCCTDNLYFRVNAMYSFGNGRFQDSRTLITGINTADAESMTMFFDKNPTAFFQPVLIDSNSATDKGTIFYYSSGVKSFIVIRLLVVIIAIGFEISTLIKLWRKERFAFNLKWGVLISLMVEYSYFVYFEFFVGWPFSQLYTNLQPSTHQIGFMLVTQSAFFVGSIASLNIDWTNYMLKITPEILSVVLSVQAIAYTIYAYFILKFTRMPRSTMGGPSNGKKLSSHGTNTNTNTSNVADRRRKELTFKMTLLSGVVLIGWISLAINQIMLRFVAGYNSEFGFWVNTLWQDVTFWFVIAVTYLALNLRLESNALSSGTRSNSNNLSAIDHSTSGNGYGRGQLGSYPPPVSYGGKMGGFETSDPSTVSHHSQVNLTRGSSEEYMYNEYPPYNSGMSMNRPEVPTGNGNNGGFSSNRSRSDSSAGASFIVPPPPLITNEVTMAYPYYPNNAQPASAGGSARREGPLVIAMEPGVVKGGNPGAAAAAAMHYNQGW
ncbi:hypothetical protein HDU76_000286 [Blyttiomyces sp. JEL0837]|nr:hypothetical protein HDU76_000286 [Blyttiomyces sp. JEL0837]